MTVRILNRKRQRKVKQLQRQRQMTDVLYRMERDAVLRSLNVEKLIAHMTRWKRPVPRFWGKPDAPLAIMHRARLDLSNFDAQEKLISAMWLVAYHYPLPNGLEICDGLLIDKRV